LDYALANFTIDYESDWAEFFDNVKELPATDIIGPDELEKIQDLASGKVTLEEFLDSPNHKDRSHVEHGASVTERFWHCPGSINLSRGRGRGTSSAAERGTAAHELGEICLRSGEDTYAHLGAVINGIEIDEEICDGVQIYLDTCRNYMGDGWEYHIEERISLAILNPPVPMAGTADFIAYNRKQQRLVCIDYKNGRHPVEIKENKQTRYYSLGAYYSLPEGYRVDDIEMIIVQPNALYGQTIKRETITFFDLIDWGYDLVEHARATLDPNAAIVSGDWCKYCPAKGVCPIRAERRLAEAQIAFSDIIEHPASTVLSHCTANLPVLTMEQRAKIFLATPMIKKFLQDIEESLIQDWRVGQEPPGLKMVESEGTRAWEKSLTEGQIKEKLKVLQLSEDQIYTRPKLASPTQIASAFWANKKSEKGVKKKDVEAEFAQLTKEFVKRPSGRKLVASADRRESLVVEGFEALEPLPQHTD
jgi:hypothetical protein